MGGGAELPHDHGKEHRNGGGDERPCGDEPRRVGEREEEGALAAIELTAGIGNDIAGASGVAQGFGLAAALGVWCRAEQDRGIIKEPIGPRKFEEGIDENHGEPDDFHFPQGAGALDGQGEIAEDTQHIVRGAQQSQRATHHEQRGGGKKGGAILKAGHDLRVDDPHLAVHHLHHPRLAVMMHQGVQAFAPKALAFKKPVINRPRCHEERQRQNIGACDAHVESSLIEMRG